MHQVHWVHWVHWVRHFAIACALAISCDASPVPAHLGAAEPPRAADPAPARASEPPAPIGVADPRFEQAITEGRAAFATGDYSAAVASFERAVDLAPEDPRALSELGWAALHARDLAKAERVLVHATELDAEPKIAAASLYNLGRVREAQDRGLEAVALYERSLVLRDNRTVRARLVRLRTSPAKAKLDIELLEGPHATLVEWCEHRARSLGLPGGFVQRCDEQLAARRGFTLEQPALDGDTGILQAKFIATNDDTTDFLHHHLAVRTAGGWFVRPEVGTEGAGAGSVGNVHATLSRLSFEPVDLAPSGGAELMLRIGETWLDLDLGEDVAHQDERRDRMLCGVGPSGRPACTSPIPLVGALRELAGNAKGPPRSEQRWTMALRLGKRAIVLTGELTAVDEAHRAWLGEHAIAFP